MKKMTEFEFNVSPGERYFKYDWDRLLDGNIWKVSHLEAGPRSGETSKVTITRFRRTAHAAAKTRNLTLQTQIIDGTDIVLQSRPVG